MDLGIDKISLKSYYKKKITYAVTIARCKIDKNKKVSKEMLLIMKNRLFEDHSLNLSHFPVQCFEYKKNQDLHYHCCAEAKRMIQYNTVVYSGWSIKLRMLKTHYDVMNWCGYCQKDKMDQVDIKYTIKKVTKFKRDKRRLSYMPHTNTFDKYIKEALSSSEELDSS